MQERRQSPRWQLNRQVKLKLEQAVEEVFCQVKDINYKGAQIVLNAKLPKDAAFRLNLKLSEKCSFDAEVWVAWCKVVDGVNHYGLYFSKIKDADKEKIYNFIYTHHPDDLKEKWWAGEQPVKPEVTNVVVNNHAVGTGSTEDHRIFERFPVNLFVRYLDLNTGKEGSANARDVSAKGLGLYTSEELRLYTALEIWLEMKDNGEPLYSRGEVVWVKKVDAHHYNLGVELEKADLMGISRVFKS